MLYDIKASDDVNKMLKHAGELAREYNGGEIATEFLVAGILCLKGTKCCDLLDEFGVLDSEFFAILKEGSSNPDVSKTPDLTPKSKKSFCHGTNVG